MSSPFFTGTGNAQRAPNRPSRRSRGRSVPLRTNAPSFTPIEGPQADRTNNRPNDDETATTGRESPKRARIDPSVADPNTKKHTSPLSAAKEHIGCHIGSLHDGIADLLLTRGIDYIDIMHKIFNKQKNIKRMEDDEDYIPHSARVAFKLTVIKDAEEMDEFKALEKRNDTFKETVQKQLKKHIIECAKIEKQCLRLKLNADYCETIHQVVSIFHTAQGVNETLTHPTALKLITDHSIAVLKHIDLNSDDFKALYIKTMAVAEMTDEQLEVDNPKIGEIKRVIQSVFPASVDCYLKQSRDNELALTIKKQAKTALLEKKTEDASKLVDGEMPADRQLLNELIQIEAEKLSRKIIKNEIANQLRKANQNSSRGPPRGAEKRKTNNGRGTGRGNAGRGRGRGHEQNHRNNRNQSQTSGRNRSPRGRSPDQMGRGQANTRGRGPKGGRKGYKKPRSRSRSAENNQVSSRRRNRS